MSYTPDISEFKCPDCGQTARFNVEAVCVFELSEPGVLSVDNDPYWDTENSCYCPECEYEGTVDTFIEDSDTYKTAYAAERLTEDSYASRARDIKARALAQKGVLV